MMSVTLTKVDQVVDMPAVEQFVRQSLAAGIADGSFPERKIGGGEAVIVARDDDEMAGFVTFYMPEGSDIMWLDLLWVRPEYRRRGIGKQLVDAVAVEASSSYLPIEFGTLLQNASMQSLAVHCGYAIDRQAIVYRRGADMPF